MSTRVDGVQDILGKVKENPRFFMDLVKVFLPQKVDQVERSMYAWNIDPTQGPRGDQREDDEDSGDWFTRNG